MVKIIVLSEYSQNPPEDGQGRVKIANGPLYALERVHTLARDESRLKAWTDKCRKDVRKWFDDDLERVGDLILSLKPGNYIDSEWCENGKGAWATCTNGIFCEVCCEQDRGPGADRVLPRLKGVPQ